MKSWLLSPSKTLVEKIINILAGFSAMMIIEGLFIFFYNWLFQKEASSFGLQFFSRFKHPIAIELFLACIIAPICEEFMFRVLPFTLLKEMKNYKNILIPAMLFTSIVFGYAHNGAISIPLQGIGGFIICTVYIKNGYSYASGAILHCMWNLALTVGFYNIISGQ